MKWLRYIGLRPALFFVLTAILLEGMYLIVTPPFQSPDEFNHFCRAYQISEGQFLPVQQNRRLGGEIPNGIKAFFDGYMPATFISSYKFTREEVINSLRPTDTYSGTTFVDFPNTSYYSLVSYLPQSLVIYVLRQLNCSAGEMYYGGKLAAFLLWLLVMYTVIEWMPFGKWLITALLLLPTNLYTINAYSADNVTNMLAFLLFACLFRELVKPDTPPLKWFITVLLLATLLAFAKLVYVALLLLLFLYPVQKFGSLKKYAFVISLIFAVALVSALYWSNVVTTRMLSYNAYHSDFRNQSTLSPNADYDLQKQHLLAHPEDVVFLLHNAMTNHPEFYLKSYVGHFGTYLDTPIQYWLFVLVYVFLLVLAIFEPNATSLSPKQKLLVLGAALFTYALIILSQHLTWNQVGSRSIDAIQGRYLAPVFPLLFLLFSRQGTGFKLPNWLVGPLVLTFVLFANQATCRLIQHRYFEENELLKSRVDWNFEDNTQREAGKKSLVLPAEDFTHYLSNTDFRSGKQAMRLDSNRTEISLATIAHIRKGDYLRIEVWVKGEQPYLLVQTDSTSTCKAERFQTGAIDTPNAQGWKKIRFILTDGVNCETQNLHLILGHLSKQTVYFDDMMCERK